ncbi:MAG: hypothetical protein H0T46_03385 [Deltaproteobacteria bacterium]|nr:hypothetical protein [Deltaproteobacteria bacterium]
MIEPLITRLVQEAPLLDASLIAQLTGELRSDGRPLAKSIARVVELVGARRIDPGIALPALAMACTTLCDQRLSEREREAARFEIETLLPVPGKPDVPLTSVSRRRT